ncbi:MAG: hypothetical protein AAFX99_22935 [Myxococcota bacterium]
MTLTQYDTQKLRYMPRLIFSLSSSAVATLRDKPAYRGDPTPHTAPAFMNACLDSSRPKGDLVVGEELWSVVDMRDGRWGMKGS